MRLLFEMDARDHSLCTRTVVCTSFEQTMIEREAKVLELLKAKGLI